MSPRIDSAVPKSQTPQMRALNLSLMFAQHDFNQQSSVEKDSRARAQMSFGNSHLFLPAGNLIPLSEWGGFSTGVMRRGKHSQGLLTLGHGFEPGKKSFFPRKKKLLDKCRPNPSSFAPASERFG